MAPLRIAQLTTLFALLCPTLPGSASSHSQLRSVVTAPPQAPDRPYDVLDYELSLNINPSSEAMEASAVITVKTTETAASLDFDLEDLTVYGATLDGQAVEFLHTAGVLKLLPESSLDKDGTHTVSIDYGGSPTTDSSRLGLSILPPGSPPPDSGGIAFTITEPEGSRRWFPCNDTPADKASLQLSVTVPTGWSVAANGVLLEIDKDRPLFDSDETGTTYVWEETHQIATYLVAFAAAPYVCFNGENLPTAANCETFVGQSLQSEGEIPLQFFARENLASTAEKQWIDTAEQLEIFSDLFGDYPFDKYGTVEAPMPFAAMEHQTMTLWATSLLLGGFSNGPVITAHELAHHWFGDLVTPSNWNDIWLNEGWATYGEALWLEEQERRESGDGAAQTQLTAYMEGVQETYLAYHSYDNDTSVYAPEEMFGVTSYDKGATVLHMLRYILGDEAFFSMTRQYLADNAFGNVTTETFIAAAEEAFGGDLSWFFEPYVYTSGRPYPSLNVGWDIQGSDLEIGVGQDDEDPIFALLLPIRVTLKNGDIVDSELWVEASPATRFTLSYSEDLESVEIDPDRWWLAKYNIQQSIPGDACEDSTNCDAQGDETCEGSECEDSGGCGCSTKSKTDPLSLLSSALIAAFALKLRRRKEP